VASANLVDGTIVNADISNSAAIALAKLATGALPAGITVASANLVDGTIVDADISASAEIAVSKLADGAARQLLQTDAAGTGVEWTGSIDLPGTLDVTGAAVLDSTLTVAGVATFNGNVTMGDADNFVFNTTTGTKIGTAVGQKLAFYNATPIVQPASANQAALTNSSGGTANGTIEAVGATNTTDVSAAINNNFTELHVLLNEIRTALVNLGLMKGAA